MAAYKFVASFCVGMELATLDDGDGDGDGEEEEEEEEERSPLPTPLFALYVSIFALSTPVGVAAATVATEAAAAGAPAGAPATSPEFHLVVGLLQGTVTLNFPPPPN